MTATDPFIVCACGRVYKVHPVSDCDHFTPAVDPDAATETARAAGEHRERLYNQLRTAVARHRFDDARRLLDELAADRGN